MTEIIILLALSFILSFMAVKTVQRIAITKNWFDKIDDRKIHTGSIPRLGGLGFGSAFILIAVIVTLSAPGGFREPRFLPVLAGMILTLIFGVIDDFQRLTPKKKLLMQICSALVVIVPDYTFKRLFSFDILGFGELSWIRYPLTAVWIIGLTNAMNFIDGVDGLAGGLSLLIALFYGIIFAFLHQAQTIVLLCACLCMTLLGFLRYNAPFPKASIFMGDGGSQFLGFTLAVLPILGQNGKFSGAIPLPYAAALLLIPILDTTAAVWRRVREKRRIDSPDRMHLHHKLMNLGLNAWGVDGIAYGLQIILGVLVFLALKQEGRLSILILGAAYGIGVGFFSAIHFMNRGVQKKLS